MATDLERLVVQLSADIKGYQSEMQRAAGITNRQARAIEARWKQSDRNLNAIGANMAKGLIAPLTGVAAALTTREVLSYADAWTKAKNSLAVAGVTGSKQSAVLDQLYKSAQANSTPIGALSDLFGKAAQASDNLGASNEDLIKFSDGVAVALKVAGTGAAEASGALTQLGQLLGSARVQAEEFNSVNEGARPILIAVANGLDAAGGAVNKLKQLVNDGKVSGQQFFQAFLKGLPTIQAMADSSTQTVEQGMTRVTNALTKYVGQTDESLGATQRLVAGLNALADNFGKTADIVLQVAGVIAASLVGRAIGGMIASLGTAGVAIASFVKALRAAATVASVGTAIAGLSAAAGPIGLVMGAAAGAILLFNTSTAKATPGAQLLSQAIARVEADAKRATEQVRELSGELKNAQVNSLTASITEGRSQIAAATGDISNLFAKMLDNLRFGLRRSFSSDIVDQFEDIRKAFSSGQASAGEVKTKLEALAKVDPKFQRIVDEFAPLLDVIEKTSLAVKALEKDLSAVTAPEVQMEGPAKAYYAGQKAAQAFLTEESRRAALSKDQLALEKEIADVRERAGKAGAPLTDKQARDQAQANLDAEKRRSAEGKKTPLDTNYRLDEDLNQVKARTAALAQEAQIVGLSVAEQEKRRVALDLEQQALSELRKEAQQKGVEDLDSITL
ncbi:tape measure protein, partial [Xanthobacter sp. V2C-8]|uniref:tape measure protein n=1 Tax=Xanthobacter albus TaxID=3119929 RepID=UPI0037296B35